MTYFAVHQEIMLVIEALLYEKILQTTLGIAIVSEVILVAAPLLICFVIDSIIRGSVLKFMVAG